MNVCINFCFYKYNYSYFSSCRFLTYHCLLHNETSWCQPGSQPPLKPTDSTTATKLVHSQSSTTAISQQASANAAKGGQDKPSSYSSTTINHSKNSNLPNNNIHTQRFSQAHLQKLK